MQLVLNSGETTFHTQLLDKIDRRPTHESGSDKVIDRRLVSHWIAIPLEPLFELCKCRLLTGSERRRWSLHISSHTVRV